MRISTLNCTDHLEGTGERLTRSGMPAAPQSAMADLEVSSQNVTASDSQVTGTVMSPAMVTFTENQILLHADSATPAEANTPQTILDLLQ